MTMYNPPRPGEFIKATFIEPLRISLRAAAVKLDVSPSTFSRLIKGDADVSPVMARCVEILSPCFADKK